MRDWRDETLGSIVTAYGEPAFHHNSMSIWITGPNQGVILEGQTKLRPFKVDEESKMFDVWLENYFIHYGDDLFLAYMSHLADLELLTQAETYYNSNLIPF